MRRALVEPGPRPSASKVLWRGVARYRVGYALGAVFLVATNLLALAIPRRLGEAINILRDATPATLAVSEDLVTDAALTILALALAAAATRIASRIFIFNAGRQIEYDFRNAVFAHLTRMSPRYFQQIASGDLTSRVSNDASSLRLLFGMAILNLVNTAIAYVVALTKMFAISPLLTLWCLAPFPFGFFAMRAVVRAVYKRSQTVQRQLAAVTTEVQETVAGIHVVKAFAAEKTIGARFAHENHLYMRETIALAVARGLMGPLMGLLGSAGSLVVLYFGGRLAIAGEVSLGGFVEFSAYVVILAWPTAAMGFVLGIWQRGRAALDRLLEVLAAPVDVRDPVDGLAPAKIDGALEFRDVRVSLGGVCVLDGTSFRVEAGERVALVGATGSGKSTVLALATRLLDPEDGAVLLDGVDVRRYRLATLRRAIAMVPQDPFLFSESIAHNVAFGLDADPEPARAHDPELRADVHSALRRAGLDGDLERFVDGVDTQVGERGVTVSGGQKQRITIARGLLVRPPVLLLDDALSSVDARTEQAILEGVLGRETRTLLLVTHRLAGLAGVDRVVVLAEGKVVESGTHAELLAQGGTYAAMCRREALEARLTAMA